MGPSSLRFCPGQHRARLLAGCLVVLLGGAGVAAHPALPHADHQPGHGCEVCAHLAGNPPAAAAAPALPAPQMAPLAVPAPPLLCVLLAEAPARSRAPPLVFTVS